MKDYASVIVPVYNSEDYLKDCIVSILNQTYPYLEIIIIDDGSTDRTVKIIQGFKDNRIKLLVQNNKGVSVARNNGIVHASGEYITFIDSGERKISCVNGRL